MKAKNLLLAGAAMAVSLPIFAANDASANSQAANTNVKVAMNAEPTAARLPRSLTDRTARKYPEAARHADQPPKLYHERWVHDEDHLY
jgi:hypothetical protein